MMIDVRDLSISIGTTRIVSDMAFSLRPGEVTVVVGPNGSGKTTLMRALAGDADYDGSITINRREVRTMRSTEQAMVRAVLPQATSLSFPFTVREIVNLGIAGGHAGVSQSELHRLPEKALARVDLEGFSSRLYQELSGGEQQRVQLARVLCQVWTPVLNGSPRWLFLDEPVASLDIKHQLALMQIARAFSQAGGGVIAILHDLNLAAMFADVMLVVRKGRLRAFGPPREVLRDELIEDTFDCRLRVGQAPRPNTPFVLPQSAMD